MLLLVGAVIEMYRDLLQLRDNAGMLDVPQSIDLGEFKGRLADIPGLPIGLTTQPSAVVLFLSNRCGTCRSLANSLSGRHPEGLWIVVENSVATPNDYTTNYDLDLSRTIVDVDNAIAEQLRISLTPLAITIRNGRFLDATSVPSTRRLTELMDVALYGRAAPDKTSRMIPSQFKLKE